MALLSARDGAEWHLCGPCSGGEVGAWRACRPDGSQVVFKWVEGRDNGDLGRSVELIGRLRAAGYPIAQYDDVAQLPGVAVVIQAFVEGGRVLDKVTHRLLDRLLELNATQSGRGGGPSRWRELMTHSLAEGEDGYCVHETLRQHGSGTSVLLQEIEAIGAILAPRLAQAEDVVHYDFHHRNILQDGDDVVAVIDWEGCRPGDRIFDLVTLETCLIAAETDPGVAARLRRQIATEGDADAVAVYVAHMSLRMVDWSLRHHPDEIEMWLGSARARLDALG
jgi:hypothetical protein